MPALFDQGFFVREPAWHGMGVVLDDYPSKEEAMRLAGHDWDVIELPSFTAIPGVTEVDFPLEGWKQMPNGYMRKDDGWKTHVRSDTGAVLHKSQESFASIPNSVAYDVAELLFDQGFQYETGITLDDGKLCAITLKLDEPIQIPGDDSIVLPFGCLSWGHAANAALRVRSGTIRQVCANTVGASEAEGKALGTDFTFRHTKNWKDRLDDAKQAVKGVRKALGIYQEMALELASIRVTPAQRDLFVSEIIGDKGQLVSLSMSTSQRVKDNIEAERAKVNALFFGPTIPEAHNLTAYGLHCAGVEYFDHLRRFRSQESYTRRTLLADNPAKTALVKTIRDLVAA